MFDVREFLQGLYDTAAETDASDRATVTPADLPACWREYYEHRAAIREYDGGQAREHAEAEALAETVAAMRRADSGPSP